MMQSNLFDRKLISRPYERKAKKLQLFTESEKKP